MPIEPLEDAEAEADADALALTPDEPLAPALAELIAFALLDALDPDPLLIVGFDITLIEIITKRAKHTEKVIRVMIERVWYTHNLKHLLNWMMRPLELGKQTEKKKFYRKKCVIRSKDSIWIEDVREYIDIAQVL